VVVSRQSVIDSNLSTVICAPVYSAYHGLQSQVVVGVDEGLKHESAIHCDGLVSLPKSALTDFIAVLSAKKRVELDHALQVALDLPSRHER
jgi:mRNA interferase MazF